MPNSIPPSRGDGNYESNAQAQHQSNVEHESFVHVPRRDSIQIEETSQYSLRHSGPRAMDYHASAETRTYHRGNNGGVSYDDGDWILNVRLPTSRKLASEGPIAFIHVAKDATQDLLAACVVQAVSHHQATSMPVLDSTETMLVGLFCESSGHFVSLQHLLTTTNMQEREKIYCTHFAFSEHTSPCLWGELKAMVLSTSLLAAVFMNRYLVADFFKRVQADIYKTVIHEPLRVLYRHGPAVLGWEGESLSKICARITYYGDSSFWERNLDECESIYSSKERVWLGWAQPVSCTILLILLAMLIRLVFKRMLMRRSQKASLIDRDALELYRAWQTILRAVQRSSATGPIPPPR